MEKLKNLPLAGIASLIFGYITFCGAAWHLGYWATFNFNYLEYANIGNLFKSSIYPLLSDTWIILVLIIVSAGMSTPMHIMLSNQKRESNPLVKSKELKVNHSFLALLIILSTSVIFIFGGILTRNNKSWGFLPFAFATLFGCIIFTTSFLKKEIKDETSRLFLLILIFLLPFFCYGKAKIKSSKIKSMFVYKAVESIETSDTILNKKLLRTAYLGGSDKNYFFYLPDRIIVINSDRVSQMTLVDVENDQNYRAWINRSR